MQKLSFDLVLDQKKSRFDISNSQKFFWIGLTGLFVFFVINWLFQNYINLENLQFAKYLIYGLFICMGIGILYGFFDSNGNNRTTKGFITFDEDEITINHAKRYALSQVKNLSFNLGQHKGELISVIIVDGDPVRSYGGDNFVEFNYQNKKHKYQFVVDSKKHKNLLTKELMDKMRSNTGKNTNANKA